LFPVGIHLHHRSARTNQHLRFVALQLHQRERIADLELRHEEEVDVLPYRMHYL
jgi:hypothetical protein